MTAPRATAAQLAGLPGMPADKSGVIRRAQLAGWAFDEEPGRGGQRRLYHVDQLPAATRAALAWHQPGVVLVAGCDPAAAQAQAVAAGRTEGARLALRNGLEQQAAAARRQSSLRQSAQLPASAQARMDGRLSVVRAYETYARASGLPARLARLAFALAYNDASIEVPPTVRAAVPRTSDSSIERWQALLRGQGITALAGDYGNRAMSGRIDTQPALQEFVQAMLVQHPHARATHVLQALQARFADSPAALPSLRSIERWIGAWRTTHAGTVLALSNPDGWKNKFMTAFGSASEGITRMNQLWELDGSPADVMLTNGRHTLSAGIDVATRCPRIVVGKTATAVGVAALLRRMLLELGVPERVKTDNGTDYTSHHITRVFAGLSADGQDMQELCPPFQPWRKPHIERFFGTLTRSLVELCPGFIGHDVAERSAIEARKSFADRLMKRGEVVEINMSSADLQAFCDTWINTVYMHNPHEGLGGATPFEAVARSAAGLRRIEDEHALDILLAEAPGNNGRRTVGKKGIRLDGTHFIAPELEAWVGHAVQVRYDALQHDLGRLHVFGGEAMSFICVAEAPERTGMDRREVAIKARAMQVQRVQATRRALRAEAKKVGTDQVVAEILRHRATAAGKLAALPLRPGQGAPAHTSPGLAAAGQAAAAVLAPARTHANALAIQAVQERLLAQAQAAAAGVPTGTANEVAARRAERDGGTRAPHFESRHHRVQWLMQQAALRELSGEERQYLAQYKTEHPASYRRMVDMANEAAAAAAAQKKDAPDGIAGQSGAI